MANYLDNSVKYVAGVGEARAKLLEKELGIFTIADLLRHYPFRYIAERQGRRQGRDA